MTCDAVGGVWQYALDLVGGLRDYRVETTLAVLGPAPSEAQLREAAADGAQIVLTDMPLEWTATDAGAVEAAAHAIARLAEDMRADLIHLNSPALAAGARFPASVVAVQHSCVGTWWGAVKGGPIPDDLRWRADLVGEGLRCAHAVVVPTAAFASATQAYYELECLPRVVWNGRAPSQRASASASADYVFAAGRLWDEGKDIATLDRVAALLPVPVIAAGPVAGPEGSRRRFPALRCLGSIASDAIAERLADRPIYVSTARYEPFGLAVLEAAQAGCALVLSDIATLRELWEGAAVFVAPGDAAGFAAAVQALLADPAARKAFGAAAAERARLYSVEAMAAKVSDLYGTLLAGKADAVARDAA